MASVPFHYIDLRTFCYATEDEKRVEDAIRNLLPDEFELDRVENKGHHSDRIIILSARVELADDMRYVLERLSELDDIDTIIGELDERIDDNCSFFLRLDKQQAFKNSIEIGNGITLRAKVEAYPAKHAAAVENAETALKQAKEQAGKARST